MPDVVNVPMVTVTTSSGVQNVSNPLLQYRFQNFPLDKKYFPSSSQDASDWYLASYPQTVRSPDADGSNSDYAHANQVLENDNLRDQVVSLLCQSTTDFRLTFIQYYALTKSSDYDEFATQAVWGPSIENVHSLVHLSIGGTWGHMSQLSYSGFDPILYFSLSLRNPS
jgi:tyrosinase